MSILDDYDRAQRTERVSNSLYLHSRTIDEYQQIAKCLSMSSLQSEFLFHHHRSRRGLQKMQVYLAILQRYESLERVPHTYIMYAEMVQQQFIWPWTHPAHFTREFDEEAEAQTKETLADLWAVVVKSDAIVAFLTTEIRYRKTAVAHTALLALSPHLPDLDMLKRLVAEIVDTEYPPELFLLNHRHPIYRFPVASSGKHSYYSDDTFQAFNEAFLPSTGRGFRDAARVSPPW